MSKERRGHFKFVWVQISKPSVSAITRRIVNKSTALRQGFKIHFLLWHMYTMEYYSAIKRNKIELLLVRWMDLESVIQSEVSQKEKNKYHTVTHMYGI